MKQVVFEKFPALDYACNEALNTLSTNLLFAGNGIKRIMLTSCHAGEGKTFLAMNLLRTFAGLGKNVILIDADIRKSVIESRFGARMPRDKMGLVHYLAGLCSIEDIVYQSNIAGAYIVPVGKAVTNSLSLLSSNMFNVLVDDLSREFDMVIVDAPPVGLIIDAAVIAKSCDGVVFVVENNSVTRRELADARNRILRTGAPILGTVLNKVTFGSHISKKYYYKSYYSSSYASEDYTTQSHKGANTNIQVNAVNGRQSQDSGADNIAR